MIPNTYSNLPIIIDTEAHLFGSLKHETTVYLPFKIHKLSLQNLCHVLQVS